MRDPKCQDSVLGVLTRFLALDTENAFYRFHGRAREQYIAHLSTYNLSWSYPARGI